MRHPAQLPAHLQIQLQVIQAGPDVALANLLRGTADVHRQRAETSREVHREVGIMADLQDLKICARKFESGKTMPITGTSLILDVECKPGSDALATRARRTPKNQRWPMQCPTGRQWAFDVVVSKRDG